MTDAHDAITEMVTRETRAWDTQNVDLLLSIFHPDFVWPWPPSNSAHNPDSWRLVLGRFDRERWRDVYTRFFADRELVRNHRTIARIAVSAEQDAGMAVVDVDTRWRDRSSGEEEQWIGRACKVYALVGTEWKLTMHTGLLQYGTD